MVFARGTTEPPGVGRIGQNFVDTLRSHVGGKSVGVYPVNYPATTDFPTAADGISDAGSHVEQMAANCPRTKMVLGGYSQGAAVMGFVTESAVPDGVHLVQALQPMPAEVAQPRSRGGAVRQAVGPIHEHHQPTAGDHRTALFGENPRMCVPGDPVCSGAGNPAAHRQYVEAGMVDQAVDFAANRIS